MGGAVGECGGNNERVLRVRSGGARTGKRAFVEFAGRRKLIVGEVNAVQLSEYGGDGLAAIRLDADVDVVSGDGACVVDSEFQVACPT